MSQVNIVKRIKIGGRWKKFSIPRNAKGNYDWNAIADGRYYVEWYAGGTRRRVSAGVIPAGLDDKQAADFPLVTTTGAQLIDQIGSGAGDTILVTGAFGNVGRTAVYAAKQRGARVIAGVLSVQKDDARSLGADQIVATDSDDEIASLSALNAIADTLGGELIGKLIPKLAPV